jgi:hypothetical protein
MLVAVDHYFCIYFLLLVYPEANAYYKLSVKRKPHQLTARRTGGRTIHSCALKPTKASQKDASFKQEKSGHKLLKPAANS